ncbi:MAG: anthranilate phosphoribosyltransferase, partial [Actinobacteria bacterium]|nr:anthranilate phosphoribosyltransferase [Actinomycetota bacterium]
HAHTGIHHQRLYAFSDEKRLEIGQPHEVVGALAFRRSKPHDPCFYRLNEQGHASDIPLSFDGSLVQCDIVGTGGDNSGSVNVSTMTSLVVAGAGVPVCKHGNRSASSKCGTADVLEALGARIELTPEQVVRCVNVAGFGFIFAQKFHPAFRHVGPVRRELGVPTIFNLLGPMANPAPVAYMLVGVANPARMGTMAAALAQRTTASLVVHGHGGLDELSLAGANRVIATRNGVVQAESTVNASDVGVTSADNGSLRGGDPAHNAQVVRDVLANRLAGPIRDVVVLNAAVALHLAGAAVSLRAGATLADSAISSGAGYAALEAFVAESQRD